jgi:glucose/arabinose dehydrogenase
MSLSRAVLVAIIGWAPIAPAVAEQTNAPEAPATKLAVTQLANGLKNPWGMQFLPDGRLLVTERPGRLRIVAKDGDLSPPIVGVPDVVDSGQGGLLDVALSPDFAKSGLIFLSFSESRGWLQNGTSVMRAKLVLDGEGGRLSDQKVIFQQQPAVRSDYHFGSRIVFARDGSLFVTLGERNYKRDEAQNPANHLGKIVHITADGAPAADNPKLPGWDPLIWSIGHRNVQGAALDPATGQLWTAEHGARGGDELNNPQPGKNYGWPIITYGRDYSGAKIGIGTQKEGMEQPVYYWDPSIATSGLMFYTGDLFTAWKGNILVGGLAGQHAERLVMQDGKVVAVEKLLTDRGRRIRDLRQGPDGAVYVLTDESDGEVLRIAPTN